MPESIQIVAPIDDAPTTTRLTSRTVTATAAAAATAADSAPTQGAYVSDAVNIHVQDEVKRKMKTVNLLLCFLDACMSDEMMNKGTYMAMADEAKCTAEVEGESSESGDSAQETKYARMLTKMVVENSTTPMTSKGHAEILKESPQPDQRIYHSTTMHAGKSDEYPNGLFQLDYTVFVLVKEMNGVVLPTPVEIKYMRGQLKSDVGGVTWRETASDFQGGTLTEAIEFSGDANETKGSIQYEENHQVRTMTFGSKGAAFCRKQDGAETCFTRQLSEANIFYRECAAGPSDPRSVPLLGKLCRSPPLSRVRARVWQIWPVQRRWHAV